jgi:hypothetical protein
MRCQVPKPSQSRPGYPAELERIVEKTLNNDPAQRFATAQEFCTALERFLVAERTLVSVASIAARLFRIRGRELAEQHQRLSQALLRSQGQVDPSLLPELPSHSSAGSPEEGGDRESIPHSGPTSGIPTSGSAATAVVLSPNEDTQPGAKGSGNKLPPLVWGLVAAGAVFVAMLALGRLKAPAFVQPHDDTVHVATPAEERLAPAAGKRDERRPDLSVDDLPVEAAQKKARWVPPPNAGAPAEPVASAAPAPDWLQQAQGVAPKSESATAGGPAEPADPELIDDSEAVAPAAPPGRQPPADDGSKKKITNPYQIPIPSEPN